MRKMLLPLALVAVLLLSAGSAAAHVTKTFGDYTVKIGWDQEPSESGVYNHVTMQVWQGGDEANAVSNLTGTLNLTMKFLDQSKALDVEESDEQPGFYSAPIEPTQPGLYVVHAEGTINGTAVNADFNIEDVKDVKEIQFPKVPTPPTVTTTATTVTTQTTPVSTTAKAAAGLGIAGIVGGLAGAALVLALRRR